jgi:putative oxidoreductase
MLDVASTRGLAEKTILSTFGADRFKDETILVARILLIVLFVVFGWDKLTNYAGTVQTMARVGAPMPPVAVLVAITMEVFAGFALAVGIWTRPLALLMALYTLGTALIGHHFWTMEGAARHAAAINFYKNISIIGGFLLLYATGAGRYSIDALLHARRAHPS